MKERSLKARALGKKIVNEGGGGREHISDSEVKAMGGKEKFIEMFQYFYSMFMTDPFMNTLFNMTEKDTNHDYNAHGRRLGLFFLSFFGDDDEYNNVRGNPFRNLNNSHNRAKGCPMRG